MASISNPSLEVGEAALNEGNYEDAIAHLSAICEIELDAAIISRAQQALVVAYAKSNQLDKAIALCEGLSLVPSEQAWVRKTLVNLRQQQRIKGASSNATTSKLPSAYQTTPEVKASVYAPGRQWRNGERAKAWKPFKRPKLKQLWLVQLASAYALFWLLRTLVQFFLTTINHVLVAIEFFEPIQLFYRDSTVAVIIFLLGLLVASPWLLDALLRHFYGLEPLRLSKLASQHPEAAKIIQKYCRQRKITLPQLGILPTNAPVAITYGNLPRNARIVVSAGLLAQLTDEETATIYATQLGHISHWNFIFLSGAMVLLQLPYTLYWQIAVRAEQFYNYLKIHCLQPPQYIHPWLWTKIPPLILTTSVIISSLCYGIYWLLRFPVLWFSRLRIYYSDRSAAEITGNPNALCRALLKNMIGIAHNVGQNQQTSWLLESFDLMLPVGHHQALIIGSLPDYVAYEEVMAWECLNPYRHWLKLTNSHPLAGERLYLLCRYAYFWKLQPEIDLPPLAPPARTYKAKLHKALHSYRALPILQSAFLSGLIFGGISRSIFWFIGIVSDRMTNLVNLWWLIWLHNGEPITFIQACVLFAFSLSIIIWINGYFPDVKVKPQRQNPRLQDLLGNRHSLPPDGEGVRLKGKLIGRQGISNGLAQDLLLQTETGAIKLHFYSSFGLVGNLFLRHQQMQNLLQQQVIVKGWLRRSGTPWIDVDSIRLEGGQTLDGGYPVWVTGLAIASALWGAYLILQV